MRPWFQVYFLCRLVDRQSILQAIAEQSRIVRLPLNQVGALSKINSEISKFEQENLRKPSVSELSSLTPISKRTR